MLTDWAGQLWRILAQIVSGWSSWFGGSDVGGGKHLTRCLGCGLMLGGVRAGFPASAVNLLGVHHE